MWRESMDTELNLLVAMRALALGLIDDDRFRVVCRGWSEDRTRSVEQRLVESCGIDEAARRRLMEDVGQRPKRHSLRPSPSERPGYRPRRRSPGRATFWRRLRQRRGYSSKLTTSWIRFSNRIASSSGTV